jgi:hypothetical protein
MEKQPKTTSKSKKEYEEMGRAVDALLQSEYLERKQAFKARFLLGIVGGAGGIIGATLVIALLLWALSLFDTLPFVENIREAIERTP